MDTLTNDGPPDDTITFDLASDPVRALNAELHDPSGKVYEVLNPAGAHAVAAGIDRGITVDVRGHAGYYAAGMNDGGTVTIHGNAGTGVAENMMSGTVRVTGDASQSAGATAHGGLLVIGGSASMRCGISMKGVDIVVGGSVGLDERVHGAGRAAGRLRRRRRRRSATRSTRPGSTSAAPSGPSAPTASRSRCASEHRAELAELLAAADLDHDPGEFRRYGSARRLYHFTSEHSGSY